MKFSSIFPNPNQIQPEERVPQTEWNTELHGGLVLPDRSVVFNFEGVGLAKLDKWRFRPAGRARSPSRGLVCRGAAAHGSEAVAAHEELTALQRPEGRVHFGGDYMTTVSSWMQDAFESAREEAMAIHARLHHYFHARATLTIGLNEEPQLSYG